MDDDDRTVDQLDADDQVCVPLVLQDFNATTTDGWTPTNIEVDRTTADEAG